MYKPKAYNQQFSVLSLISSRVFQPTDTLFRIFLFDISSYDRAGPELKAWSTFSRGDFYTISTLESQLTGLALLSNCVSPVLLIRALFRNIKSFLNRRVRLDIKTVGQCRRVKSKSHLWNCNSGSSACFAKSAHFIRSISGGALRDHINNCCC